jgi:hypothetical protein
MTERNSGICGCRPPLSRETPTQPRPGGGRGSCCGAPSCAALCQTTSPQAHHRYDGLHIGNDLVLVGALGIGGEGHNHPLECLHDGGVLGCSFDPVAGAAAFGTDYLPLRANPRSA